MKNKILFIVLLLFIIYPKNILAKDYYFNEEFNGTFSNLDTWTVNNHLNRGIISFTKNNGFLTLSTVGYNFPLIVSNNIFPVGNFDLEINMKYLHLAGNGDGIVISDNAPVYLSSAQEINGMFWIWQDSSSKFTLSSNICSINNPNCSSRVNIYSSVTNNFDLNKVKISLRNNKYHIYFNDNLLFESVETIRRPNNIWMGNPKQVSNYDSWYDFAVDYIRIKQLPDHYLDVPFYSQNDPAWGAEIYDHAQNWYPTNPTIDRWGCAMTSMAMVLNYWGIDVTPNNNPLNPYYLNQWLKSDKLTDQTLFGNEPGYTKDGGISWVASLQLARFFKPEMDMKITSADMNYANANFMSFKNHIQTGIPEILWVKGHDGFWNGFTTHWVVGKGFNDDYTFINDPEDLYATIPTNFPVYKRVVFYNNPSLLNKGMIQLYSNSNVYILIVDSNGNKLGRDQNGTLYEQIANAYFNEGETGAGTEGGLAIGQDFVINNVGANDTFQVKVFGQSGTSYDIEMHNLTSDNKTYLKEKTEVLSGNSDQFEIVFTDNESTNINDNTGVSFDELIAFVESGYTNKKYKNQGMKTFLVNLILSAKKDYEDNKVKNSQLKLNHVMAIAKSLAKKSFEANWREELVQKTMALKNEL